MTIKKKKSKIKIKAPAGKKIKKGPDIAIIGMACRFPDAEDYLTFWKNLEQGKHSIREIPADRWEIDRYYSPDPDAPNKMICKWAGLLPNIDRFDNRFFSISPREANNMDPHQRLLLEETMHCIEDSGVSLGTLREKKTSVFIGITELDYYLDAASPGVEIDGYACLGNFPCILANRISYTFGLKGQSMALDAACASSLTTIHEAKRSLLTGESDYAIVASACLISHPWKFISFSKARALSPDGICRTFDKDANGFVPGEGVGVLLLQRLDEAAKAGFYIYGVIKATAVNHGGKALSLTAPRVQAQSNVISAVYEEAGISPETVSYIEAHGTGTSLGDPIEMEGLTRAFRKYTNKNQFCKIGSVKTNIGHLGPTAGMASIIKVLLMMQHRKIPATLNVKNLNPIIDFENSPFQVAVSLSDWDHRENSPLRAGVSSFGIGGTNAHLLLESFDDLHVSLPDEESPGNLFILSAKSAKSLDQMVRKWKSFVNSEVFKGYRLQDICMTLLTGREHFPYRYGFYLSKKEELPELLNRESPSFANKGDHAWGVRIGHVECFDMQKIQTFLKSNHLLEQHIDLFPSDVVRKTGASRRNIKNNNVSNNTLHSFLIGYAYVGALIELGLKPSLITGEGTGTWISLTLSGIIKLEDTVSVLTGQKKLHHIKFTRPKIPFFDTVHNRTLMPYLFDEAYLLSLIDQIDIEKETLLRYVKKGQLLSESQYSFKKQLGQWDVLLKPTGREVGRLLLNHELLDLENKKNQNERLLLLVILADSTRKLNWKWGLSEQHSIDDPGFSELLDLVEDEVMTREMLIRLLTGDRSDIGTIAKQLEKRQKHIHAENPYCYLKEKNRILLEIQDIPAWIKRLEETDSFLLPFNTREKPAKKPNFSADPTPVSRQRGILGRGCHLPVDEKMTFFEFGKFTQETSPEHAIGVEKIHDLDKDFKNTLLRLWLEGVVIDWAKRFPGETFKKVSLPGYCFNPQQCWRERSPEPVVFSASKSPESKSSEMTLFQGKWETSDLKKKTGEKLSGPILVFDTDLEIGKALGLRVKNLAVIVVKPGENYRALGRAIYTIDPGKYTDYQLLTAELKRQDLFPVKILHLWSGESEAKNLSAQLQKGIYSLFYLTKALVAEQHGERIRLLYVYPGKNIEPQYAGVGGFARTIRLETQKLIYKAVGLHRFHESRSERMLDLVLREFDDERDGDVEVRYEKNWQRQVKTWKECDKKKGAPVPLRKHGVYLLTGGTGGLGHIFAGDLAKNYHAKLVLSGRSKLSGEKEKKIREIESLGADVLYVTADVSNRKDANRLIREVKSRFGVLHGVIHCAGVIRDSFLVNKNPGEFEKVLKPKVYGTMYLDEAAAGENLDFFVLFSSVTSVLGNIGQCDYAYANSFMDYYAEMRENLRLSGRRSGKSLSINWSLWQEGGMQVDEKTREWMREQLGIKPLSTRNGIQAFQAGLLMDSHQLAVTGGQGETIEKVFGLNRGNRLTEKNRTPVERGLKMTGEGLKKMKKKVEALLKETISKETKFPLEEIHAEELFGNYGIDSVTILNITRELEKDFGELSKTLFFEYPTIAELTDYFIENHKECLIEYEGNDTKIEPGAHEEKEKERLDSPLQEKRFRDEDIAIIGVSGRYPSAGNLDEFWENLREGKDCITEIPGPRWNYREYYDPDIEKAREGKIYCKWGGFIKDADTFDPLFFNILPGEAETIDPREGLFLQTAWSTLEDAGYTGNKLNELQKERGMETGVFVGVTTNSFQVPGLSSNQGSPVIPSALPWSMANRISYFFDFRGPSMPVDTACSSSLYAIHLACESLKRDECQMALAGGVNLYFHPSKYIELCQNKMLSPTGRCSTFGQGGDGFVPGEGVGCVLLKPLSRAEQDGDHIYAVILGTHTNHSGRTSGYMVPNPDAQGDLIRENCKKAGVDPRTISYVESAAVGSKIGDIIEVTALTKAFSQQTKERQFCAIGSVKPNIGHLEAASGISQLSKVILELQHKQLVPSIHAEPLNPDLNFNNTPFYLQREFQEWKRPIVKINGEEREFPRRATVSSFGAGGSNAHLIVEEYTPPKKESIHIHTVTRPQVVVFSAKSPDRLLAVVRQMRAFIEPKKDLSLPNLAYTLQVGREAMEYRAAMVASNLEELVRGMKEYLESLQENKEMEASIPIFTGNLKKDHPGKVGLLAENNLEELAYYWAQGGKIPWESLHEGEDLRRISLPTYPFARGRPGVPGGGEQHPEKIKGNRSPGRRKDDRFGSNRLGGHLKKRIGELLGITVEALPVGKSLDGLGFNSVNAVMLKFKLEQDFCTEIPLAAFSGHQTIEHLESRLNEIITFKYPGDQPNAPGSLPKILPDPVNRYRPFPLTDIQESFLTGRKLCFGNDWVGCHIYFEIEVSELDIYRLNKAWERLMNYHEMLRSVILPDGQQKILEETPPYTFKIVDLRRKNECEQSGYLENLRKKMSHKVYETDQWPLFEIRISICPDSTYFIHFSIDEFVLDGSGIHMLLQQWQQLYEEPDRQLPGLNVSFRDYVTAIKKFEDSKRCKRDLEYWIGKLENMPGGPILPLHQKSIKPGSKENYYRLRLNGSLEEKQWRSLKKKAHELHVSGTVLLLSIFSEFLRFWCRQETFSLVLTFFNRQPLHPQIDRVLGPFISTNIFTVEKKKGDSLEYLSRYNQQRLWEDLDHSSVSGIRVLRELKARGKIPGSFSLPVVFTSMLNNLETGNTAAKNGFFKQISFMVSQTPQVYLDHQIWETDGKLRFSWDAAEGYFEPGVIDHMFFAYSRVLDRLSPGEGQWDLDALVSEIKGENLPGRNPAKEGRFAALPPMDLKLEVLTADRFKPFPLTDQQQAYAFGRTGYMAGGKTSCQFYQEIEAEALDIMRLEKAWQKLMETHEMLMTVIRSNGTQRILEEVPGFKIKVADLRGRKPGEVEAELKNTRDLMVRHVFALDEWPYFDLRVSLIDEVKSRIHFSIDLLIADGNSISLLLKQLFYFYENQTEKPGTIGISFRDYVLSIQKYKKTKGYRESIRYWENKFVGVPPGPQLPMKDNRDNPISYERKRFNAILWNWRALKERAGKLSVSPGMVLLTVYGEVLAAWSDYKPFSLAIPCWERLPLHPKIHELVGDFTAMSWVVIRGPAVTFEEKIRLNHNVVQEDLSHMAVSGLKALRKVVKGRLNFPVVFTNMITQPNPDPPKGFKMGEASSKTPHVYLDNISEEHDGQLYLHWDAAKGVYPQGMIEEMFAGYRRVLESLANDPDGWVKTNFDRLINARPEKYSVVR